MPETAGTRTILDGVAAIISASAWPLVTSIALWGYRKEIRETSAILVKKLGSADQIKVGPIEIASRVIESAISSVPVVQEKNSVPEVQLEAGKELEIKVRASGVDEAQSLIAVGREIRELARKYERNRAASASSDLRTWEMDKVVAQMRTLGRLAVPLLTELAYSPYPGERLAAIAILQVHPDHDYVPWLESRMDKEVPFVFFHAALALRQYVVEGNIADIRSTRGALQRAVNTVQSLDKDRPHQNTVNVLKDALEILDETH